MLTRQEIDLIQKLLDKSKENLTMQEATAAFDHKKAKKEAADARTLQTAKQNILKTLGKGFIKYSKHFN